jgi:hypothetical protein
VPGPRRLTVEHGKPVIKIGHRSDRNRYTGVRFTIPELAGAYPEVRFTIPELAGAYPEVRFTIPELAGTYPEVRFTIPELAGMYPEVRFTIPELAGTKTGKKSAYTDVEQIDALKEE